VAEVDFHIGYGGSLIIIDMDARTTFGYAMNKMGLTTMGDERAMAMIRAMWAALGDGRGENGLTTMNRA
jgi:hypothetical protein